MLVCCVIGKRNREQRDREHTAAVLLWNEVEINVRILRAEGLERYLAAGAHFHVVCPHTGRSLLHLAVQHGRNTVVQMLLDRGADVNAQQFINGDTPLHFATFRGYGNIAQMLISRGADVNHAADDGCTPLHRLVTAEEVQEIHEAGPAMSHEALGEMLLENGGDLSCCSNSGATPEDLVNKHGHPVFRAVAARRAFAMGLHGRLGATSLVRGLDVDVARMIMFQV